MSAWHADPSVLLGLALLVGVYLTGVRRLAVRPGERPGPLRVVLFLLGVLVLGLALQSPLDGLGDRYLLSMHMTQHMLLVLVVPPLLLGGTPAGLVRPLLRVPLLAALLRRLTAPATAFLVFNVIFSLAHLPGIFTLTLRSEGVHIAEHLLFLATAVLAWWPVLSPLPELPALPYPLRMLYLFGQTLPCGLVGAFITLSGHVLYAPYAVAPRVWDLSPLQDQQVGGLIMWIGGSLYYYAALAVVFFVWAAHDEQRRPGGGLRLIRDGG